MSPVEGATMDIGSPWELYQQHEPINVGSPVAGQGFTYTVPGTVVQRVVSVSFKLVNAVAVASRIPRVEFLNASGGVFASFAAPFVLTSGQTSRFTFAVGIVQAGANDAAVINAPIPGYKLMSGLGLRVAVAAVNAADQISEVSLFVDQWPVRE